MAWMISEFVNDVKDALSSCSTYMAALVNDQGDGGQREAGLFRYVYYGWSSLHPNSTVYDAASVTACVESRGVRVY